MSKAIELKGTVEKVVRANGKADAQMTVTIPLSDAINIPLGAVRISIQTLQSALFGPDAETATTGRGVKK